MGLFSIHGFTCPECRFYELQQLLILNTGIGSSGIVSLFKVDNRLRVRLMNKILIIAASIFLVSCADNNSEPKYGKSSGLLANCRAYVQASVDDWRNGSNSTEDTMNALERNCGIAGTLWDYRP